MKRKRLWWGRLGWIPRVVTADRSPAWSCGPGPRQSAARAARESRESRTSEAIPFTLRDGYLIVVEGRIGAHRHLKLVLDTGATHSVLRPDLAREQMSLRRTVRIVNLDHVLTQELAEVPDFELGPIRIPLLPVMLNDLELSARKRARSRWTYRFGRVAGAKFQH